MPDNGIVDRSPRGFFPQNCGLPLIGYPDGRYLIDHVHPSIEGHQLIAAALCDEFIRRGIVHPADGWKEVRKKTFQEHFDGLDSLVFAVAR